jgi:ectoine hydroxylase-related dioxygenase (phytanoyl-CoA dioxygenase family)
MTERKHNLPNSNLTHQSLRSAFEANGFAIVRGLVPDDDCAALLEHVQAIRQGNDQSPRVPVQNQYGRLGQLSMVKINQLTERVAAFEQLAHRDAIVDIVEALIGPGARIFRDVVVVKPGQTGGVLRHHQDSAYWDVEPKCLVSAWIALSPAPAAAGPLSVVPGSHDAPVPHSLAISDRIPVPAWVTSALRGLVSRAGTGDNTASASGRGLLWRAKRLVLASGSRFAPVLARLSDYHVSGVVRSDCVVIEAEPGDVVFFHSLLVHGTGPNTTRHDRAVSIISYMPSGATLPRAEAASLPLARNPVG